MHRKTSASSQRTAANDRDTNGLQWHQPDLARYRDETLDTYAPSTVSAHLSTIRARYRETIRDNGTRGAVCPGP